MISANIKDASKIITVIDRLGKQSELERSDETNIAYNDLMLAITKDTGKFLNILITTMNANTVLEIGTSTGYSTLWFALALCQNENNNLQKVKKKIITVENNPMKVKRAEKNFIDAEVGDMIKIIEGNALEILLQLSNDQNNIINNNRNNLFDFIFFDADKENLSKYFDLALPLLRKGGIIVTDNILYPEEYRSDMSKYVKYVRSNESVMSVTVPVGYGEEITIKSK
jgi:caffeoyl-CoA O-methyltransferase